MMRTWRSGRDRMRRRRRSEGVLVHVEVYGPVVHVAVADIRLCTERVAIAAKHAPVHVVEVLARVALADFVLDAIGEVVDKVVDRPVQIVLISICIHVQMVIACAACAYQ